MWMIYLCSWTLNNYLTYTHKNIDHLYSIPVGRRREDGNDMWLIPGSIGTAQGKEVQGLSYKNINQRAGSVKPWIAKHQRSPTPTLHTVNKPCLRGKYGSFSRLTKTPALCIQKKHITTLPSCKPEHNLCCVPELRTNRQHTVESATYCTATSTEQDTCFLKEWNNENKWLSFLWIRLCIVVMLSAPAMQHISSRLWEERQFIRPVPNGIGLQ